jgi:hypothetical protein
MRGRALIRLLQLRAVAPNIADMHTSNASPACPRRARAHVCAVPALPRLSSSLLALILILLLAADAGAQTKPKFQIKRTKRDSMPVRAQLYGGYNGMSHPSEKMQDMFEGSGMTSWSGVMIGLQAMVPIDTLLIPIWVGIDAHYQRHGKRNMRSKGVVTKSDGQPIPTTIETVNAWGGSLLIGFDLLPSLTLLGGGGPSFAMGSHDAISEVIGDFQDVMVWTVTGAINYAILRYDHGSIDTQFRVHKGFGDWGNVQIESLLGFTFNF